MESGMWNQRSLKSVMGHTVALCIGISVGCAGDLEEGAREGKRAPDFQVATLDGTRFALGDSVGRPTLLVFWASWCGPCRREADDIRAIVGSYGDRLRVLSINSGEDPTKVRLTATEWGLTWPVGLDPKARVSHLFEVDALPLVLVIDASGRVRFRGNGLPSDSHRLLDGLAE